MSHIITAGQISIAYERFGDPGDPPIVMVMGATASMLWWPAALCEELAGHGYQVVRYDHRDTGRSTSVPLGAANYSAEDLADDLLALLDGLDFAAAHIVGMSLGGLIGQMVAIAHPDRVLSLTLIGAEPLGWDGDALPTISPDFLAHFQKLATLDWSDRDAVSGFMLESARLSAGNGIGFDADRERRRIEAEIDRAGGDLSSAINHGSVQVRGDWTGRAAEVTAPVLVLHGAVDPIAPIENARATVAAITGARLVILDDIGHAIPDIAIPLMVEAITSFVATTPVGSVD